MCQVQHWKWLYFPNPIQQPLIFIYKKSYDILFSICIYWIIFSYTSYYEWIYYTHADLGLPNITTIPTTLHIHIYMLREIWPFIKMFSRNFLSKKKTYNIKATLFKDNFLMLTASFSTNCKEENNFEQVKARNRQSYIHIGCQLQTFLNFNKSWMKLIFLHFGKYFGTLSDYVINTFHIQFSKFAKQWMDHS